MRFNPMEVVTLPFKVVEFELQMADRVRRAASRAIYQTFSSEYIANKRMAEAEQLKAEDMALEKRLDRFAAANPIKKSEAIDLTDDLVIDIRDGVDSYQTEPTQAEADQELTSVTTLGKD